MPHCNAVNQWFCASTDFAHLGTGSSGNQMRAGSLTGICRPVKETTQSEHSADSLAIWDQSPSTTPVSPRVPRLAPQTPLSQSDQVS